MASDNGPSVHDRTAVFGMPDRGLIGIMTKDSVTGRQMSIRFPRGRVMQLCLDLLEMAAHQDGDD